MSYYVLFLCLHTLGSCQMVEHGHMSFAGYMPVRVYTTLESCRVTAEQASQQHRPTKSGRFVLPTNSEIWYECRGRRSDSTWEGITRYDRP